MPAWLNLPNSLTAVRLVLTPLIVRWILEGRHELALAAFFVAGVTDFLDGLAARRLASKTPSGAYFDPIADKVLLSGVFLALAAAAIVPWWFVGLVFGRDLFILLGAGALLLATPVRKYPPSTLGKLSTLLQIATALAWMVRNAWPSALHDGLAWAALIASAAATVASGADYALIGTRIWRNHRLRA
jgi:cardiolipin synthase